MQTTPRYSIIVPIYNTGKYLRQCIESVVSQPYSDYELILVDDGSTDESIEIEARYAEQHDHIVVLQSNSGCVSSARNMGVEHANGEYVLFVDSDDYLLPNSLNVLSKAALKYPEADFIQAPFAVLSNGAITARSKRFDVLDAHADRIWVGIDYIVKMTFAITYPWNSLIKRSFMEDTHLRFNPKINAQEDLLFIIELFVNGAKGVLIKEPTYMYRFGREGSLTSADTNLTPHEIAKRKKCLRSMIDCSACLGELIPKAPQIKDMLTERISLNLTGCIGGSAFLYPDMEIFEYMTQLFPRIPLAGAFDRKLLASIYNMNHRLAFDIRKASANLMGG